MKHLLFVCWDGPQVSYLEGLFLPIFKGLKEYYKIHVIQYSWSSELNIDNIQKSCEVVGITYNHYKIIRKPHPILGMALTLAKGASYLKKYLELNNIDIIMPRSNMPALMTLCALRGNSHVKFIFDADGLPLEEKVDFDGLPPNSLQFKLLKILETKTLTKADAVITRTDKAIRYLTKYKPELKEKFFTVKNGRDITFFNKKDIRNKIRMNLNINENSLILIYIGSLGPQYGVEEMLLLFNFVSQINNDAYLLILSNQREFLNNPKFKNLMSSRVIIKSVPFQKVPDYLSAADVGLAIRLPFFSMIGVAPIKIGEYLLSHLPVVASAGVGDSDAILRDKMSCFILKNHEKESLEEAAKWINDIYMNAFVKEDARALGIKEFSLEKSIESYKVVLNHLR